MSCEYCNRLFGHDSRCPNYVPPKAKHYCSVCGEGIYDGEQYVKNHNGEYRHWDCFYGMKELLEWLGYKIERMDEDGD